MAPKQSSELLRRPPNSSDVLRASSPQTSPRHGVLTPTDVRRTKGRPPHTHFSRGGRQRDRPGGDGRGGAEVTPSARCPAISGITRLIRGRGMASAAARGGGGGVIMPEGVPTGRLRDGGGV